MYENCINDEREKENHDKMWQRLYKKYILKHFYHPTFVKVPTYGQPHRKSRWEKAMRKKGEKERKNDG